MVDFELLDTVTDRISSKLGLWYEAGAGAGQLSRLVPVQYCVSACLACRGCPALHVPCVPHSVCHVCPTASAMQQSVWDRSCMQRVSCTVSQGLNSLVMGAVLSAGTPLTGCRLGQQRHPRHLHQPRWGPRTSVLLTAHCRRSSRQPACSSSRCSSSQWRCSQGRRAAEQQMAAEAARWAATSKPLLLLLQTLPLQACPLLESTRSCRRSRRSARRAASW